MAAAAAIPAVAAAPLTQRQFRGSGGWHRDGSTSLKAPRLGLSVQAAPSSNAQDLNMGLRFLRNALAASLKSPVAPQTIWVRFSIA